MRRSSTVSKPPCFKGTTAFKVLGIIDVSTYWHGNDGHPCALVSTCSSSLIYSQILVCS